MNEKFKYCTGSSWLLFEEFRVHSKVSKYMHLFAVKSQTTIMSQTLLIFKWSALYWFKQQFWKNENHFVNFTGATFALATHVYTSVHKAWFPYDRPERPSRLKIWGPSDRDDHMETQQRRLRRPGRSGRSRSLGSLPVLSGRSGRSWKFASDYMETILAWRRRSKRSKHIPKCSGYSKIQCSFFTGLQKMGSKIVQQTRESEDEALAPVYGTVSGRISV